MSIPGREPDSELGCGTYPRGTEEGAWTTKSLVMVSPSSFICGHSTRWHTKYTAPTTNSANTTPTMELMVLEDWDGGSSVGSGGINILFSTTHTDAFQKLKDAKN